jgi:nucleotide-binding universal stress UspA family protein
MQLARMPYGGMALRLAPPTCPVTHRLFEILTSRPAQRPSIRRRLHSANSLYLVSHPPQIYAALNVVPTIEFPTTQELNDNAEVKLAAFVAQSLSAQNTVTRVSMGTASTSIIEYAKKIDAAMIIMTTSIHSTLEPRVMGSTTDTVLRHAQCPVVSVRNPQTAGVATTLS